MSDEMALASAAQLFGRLVLAAIDPQLADELWEPEPRAALAQLGLEPPDPATTDFEELGTEYEDFFHPNDSPPLVQSICEEGRNEGEVVALIVEIVESFGVELEPDDTRGLPPDHLGTELLVWAELADQSSVASAFAKRHLAWAIPHLERRAGTDGFYARLSGVLAQFIAVIAGRVQ